VKLFEQTIPELALDGVTVVLLDEIETLGVDRQKLSLEANPIDVHRATDAVLTGIYRLAQQHKNVLLIATTNFPKAVDAALLSRADHIEPIGPPSNEARIEIILDTLRAVGTVWKDVRALEADVDRLAAAAEGLDGRRIRKGIFAAAASDIETAKDPNKLSRAQIEHAFAHAIATLKDMGQ
jgi:AAA+ superfamily predicted ATPase